MLNTAKLSQKLKSVAGITLIALLLIWTITFSAILAFQERKWWNSVPPYHSVGNGSDLNTTLTTTTTIFNRNTTTSVRRRQPTKIILAWTKWFHTDWPAPFGPFKCGQYKCLFTNDRSRFSISDALLFHGADTDINYKEKLPKQPRPHRQLWGFQTLENPFVSREVSVSCSVRSFHNNLFNLMMTYTRQADIRRCYGWISKKTNKTSDNYDYFELCSLHYCFEDYY